MPSDHVPTPDDDEWQALAKVMVGKLGLRDAVTMLRRAMLEEALGRAKGSRRRAAALLAVDRRAVQRMLTEWLG